MNAVISGLGGIVGVVVAALFLGAVSVFAYRGNSPGRQALTDTLSEPLNGATTATVNIDTGDGNLRIDRLTSGEPLLARGSLEYTEKQGQPVRTLTATNGQADLTLRGGIAGQPWLRLPWAACNGATTWQVHLNPGLPLDITAHSNGGNVQLDLAGMIVTRVLADTAGGNIDVVLPDKFADLNVAAKTGAGDVTVEVGSGIASSNIINAGSGAGNVEVRIPVGVAARIHASSGLGKVIVDSGFRKIDGATYQSPGYDSAAAKVDITLSSGAGNATVSTR